MDDRLSIPAQQVMLITLSFILGFSICLGLALLTNFLGGCL